MVDEYNTQRLSDALARDSRVSELGLAVTVESGRVHLSGEVATEKRRQAIATVATEVLPGHEVLNQVTVSAYGEPENMEHLP